MALGWFPFGRDAGFYPGLEKGYYAEEGLEVRIDRGFGGADNTKKLAAKAYEVTNIDPGSLLVARSQGIGVRMIGMYHDKAPFVLRWLEGSGIKGPKDLEGRTLGAPAGDSNLFVLPVLAELNGVDFKKIKIINVDPAAREAMLVAGKVDVITGFIVQEPIVMAMAAKQGKKVKTVLFADYGVDVYGFGVAVTDEYVKEKGETLRKFLRASVKAMTYAIEHPEETVKMWHKHHPAGDLKTNREVWDITLDIMLTPEQERLGIWRMDAKKWERTRDILTKGYNLTAKVPVEDLYTNDYLPQVMPPKRGPRAFPRLW
jgi:NitT/TauT family transport system substrate-binding protein